MKFPWEKERHVLYRQDAETSGKFGCDPYDRPMETMLEFGIVNVDKPAGPTSHEVSAYVKKILGVKKAGHSGTLDPAVTGVLPVGLGRATRIVHPLLKAGKEYISLMHLHDDVSDQEILKALEDFRGEIEQMVPVRSAVKRRLRKRNIYYLEVLEIKGRDVLFRAGTEAGTYIRKLCHDIGEALGVGAHMAELRRSRAGPFDEDSLVTLQDLNEAYVLWKEGDDNFLRECIQPIERGVDHLSKVWVLDTTVDSLCHGASLKMPGIARVHSDIADGDTVAVMTLKGELVMVGDAVATTEDMLADGRGVAVKPGQVFMRPGEYPKIQ